MQPIDRLLRRAARGQGTPAPTVILARTAALLAFAVALGATVQAVPAAAQAAAPAGGLRVAVIDTEKILKGSQAGKKAVAELTKLQGQREAELRARQQEIKDLSDKIAAGKLSLAEDKLADMSKQYEDKMIALRRLEDDANRELSKKKDDLLGTIEEKVMPVINRIGKEQGYTLIFRKFESGLIYADEAVDITDTVIQRMDSAAAGK